MYCMEKELGGLRGLRVTMLGDLKHGRTVHSLSRLLMHFGVKMNFVSPSQLKLPSYVTDALKAKNADFTELVDVRTMHHTTRTNTLC